MHSFHRSKYNFWSDVPGDIVIFGISGIWIFNSERWGKTTFSVRIDKIFIRQRTFSSNRKNSTETDKCILYTLQEGRDKKDKKEVKWQKKQKNDTQNRKPKFLSF